MYYEIYLDMVFLTNLIMDYVLLLLVGNFLGCQAGRFRTAAGAIIGALMACLLLYLPSDNFFPFTILLQGLTAVMMVKTGCCIKSGSMLIKGIITLYLAAFLCGGFWQALLVKKEMTFKLFLLFTGCSYLIFTCMGIVYDYVQIKRRNIYPVRLGFEGHIITLYGFYDTGNLLRDPVTGHPISIVGPQILQELLPEKLWENLKNFQEKSGELENTGLSKLKPHFVPCRTVGGEGMLLAVTLEDLCIHTTREAVHIPAPVLAVTWNPSALGTDYQMILHSGLLA